MAGCNAFKTPTGQHPDGVVRVHAHRRTLSILAASVEEDFRLPRAVLAVAQEYVIEIPAEAIPGEPGAALMIQRQEWAKIGIRGGDGFIRPARAVIFGGAKHKVVAFALLIDNQRIAIRLYDNGGT